MDSLALFFRYLIGRKRSVGLKGPALFLILQVFCFLPSSFANYVQLEIAMDVKSRFSDGCSSVYELGAMAEERGLDGIIFGDHARFALEYGIWPFERLLKKREQLPSVLEGGVSAYLASIRDAQRQFDKTLLIPGVEAAPFYYWSGSLLEKNLVANNWDKHLLLVGLPSVEAYEQLPIMNSNFSWQYLPHFQVNFLIYFGVFFLSVLWAYKKRVSMFRWIVAGLMFFLMLNNHPLRSSKFDPYGGDKKAKPYQEMVDYASREGALVFWNHLESVTAMGKNHGKLSLSTLLHPEDILETKNFTGFQALNDTPVTSIEPEGIWDQALLDNLQGLRGLPSWGFGANDFHCEDQDGHRLGSVRTVVLVSTSDESSVIEALKLGRMYAVNQREDSARLSLDRFEALSEDVLKPAVMGETLHHNEKGFRLKIRMHKKSRSNSISTAQESVRVRLIKDARTVMDETVTLPYETEWVDPDASQGRRKSYYRLIAENESKDLRLVSNPIFVQRGEESEILSQVSVIEPPSSLTDQNIEIEKVFPSDEAKKPESQTEKKVQGSDEILMTDTPLQDRDAAAKIDLPSVKKDLTGNKMGDDESPGFTLDSPLSLPVEQVKAQPEKKEALTKIRYVEVNFETAILRSGPGKVFAEKARAKKGERFEYIASTSILFKGKPWLRVKKDKKVMFVWSGVVSDPR